MGLDHGPPNFCQKVWFLIMGTMVIIPIWVLIMYPHQMVVSMAKNASNQKTDTALNALKMHLVFVLQGCSGVRAVGGKHH